MKIIGWIGILHVTFIVVWIIINIIFSISHPVDLMEERTSAEIGIAFYSEFPGYLGLDHGSKALIMLLSIALPVGLFVCIKPLKNFQLPNIIALVSGCLGFALYSLSLMLQAVTAEYVFQLYNANEDMYARQFATLLYEWSMLEGGLSVSMYILSNILLAVWVLIHSAGLFKLANMKKIRLIGYAAGGLLIVSYLVSWFFLMQGKQNMHDINEFVGLFFILWILMIGIQFISGRLRA
ncbi:hypothetical protein [Oceanobacillus sp. J11TS1]|uniref:hypothetical protein n=1 Tax=Oceanobacillus sp. J11TS1 TaxID=2807191 RepID=UPI001B16E3E6|nr:hypothetical protein [Oceanobacillus sp. J11TS1]GIO25200.1 hypothetical protein J11TS1_37810 [Oceanobacillus sp. J11TS1]